MKYLNPLLFILYLPMAPMLFLQRWLMGRPCPECGSKWRTELLSEWDGEDWGCRVCNHYWVAK